MKLLFLDVDGVLNSRRAFIAFGPNAGLDVLDPVACRLMGRLVSENDLKVVLSSTWRLFHTLEEMKKMLSEVGWVNAPLIAKTPRLSSNIIRGDEIREFLSRFDQPVEQYCCVDDDMDFYPDQNLIKTTFEDGFLYRHAQEAARIFGAEFPKVVNVKDK